MYSIYHSILDKNFHIGYALTIESSLKQIKDYMKNNIHNAVEYIVQLIEHVSDSIVKIEYGTCSSSLFNRKHIFKLIKEKQ